MRTIRWAGVVMVAALAGGCQPKPPPPPPPPVEPTPTPQMAASLRQEILNTDPLAKIGEVTAVMPQDNLLAIEGMNISDIREGDAMQVIGGEMHTLAEGVIYRIDREHNIVVLKYHDVPGARRAPEQGDLGVRMSDHPMPPGAHVTAPSGENAMPPINRPPANNPPANNVPPPAPVTQPTAPAGGGDNKPADNTQPATDKKPDQADTISPTPSNGIYLGAGHDAKDAPAAKPSDFNK
jgi:hypothetical protein